MADSAANEIEAIDCLTGRPVRFHPESGSLLPLPERNSVTANLPFVGPGLVDLQVNGVNGVDFNSPTLSEEGLLQAANYLLSQGVTTFFPTIITNSRKTTCQLLKTINDACRSNSLLDQCIGGIHLEGPFISKLDGARGAHNKKYVKAPDWQLFEEFQQAAGNRIRLTTLSPEWDGSDAFIRQCRKAGVIVSIGHSMASPQQIAQAVRAGASMSTHLGNAVPLMLPRHPNVLWEQLANDGLHASIIADGFHVPASFIKVVLKAKGRKCFLVSDATYFSGMRPGTYHSHIGGEVLLEENRRLSIKDGKGLLAGATKTLLQGVEYLLSNELANLKKAWRMASILPLKLAGKSDSKQSLESDKVVFTIENGKIRILKVYKGGSLCYKAP